MSAEMLLGSTVREQFLPFALPSIGEEEIAEVVDTLRSGWVTTGPKTARFESDFKAFTKASHAIAVNSCTAGLHVALAALGIGPGDEVIVPTFTFCATANVVVHLGARPILVDVGVDFCITAEAIEAAITPDTKAIMPVHFGGQAAQLDEIYEIAARHGLAVIEDAAHAVGATFGENRIGSDRLQADFPALRRVTVFSFYANKNMTTGEGGMITTSDSELAAEMRRLILHGMSKDAWKRYESAGSWYYEVASAGYKSNMTDISAAMGIHQLRRLDGFIETRQRYAEQYDIVFRGVEALQTPIKRRGRNHVYHLYPLLLNPERLTIDRGRFIEELKKRNIGSSVHFIPVHMHPYYRETFGYKPEDIPMADFLYSRVLSLPLYPSMTEADVSDVIGAVFEILSTYRRL